MRYRPDGRCALTSIGPSVRWKSLEELEQLRLSEERQRVL